MTTDDPTSDPQDSDSYGDYSVDSEDQLQPADTLDDPDVEDTLDRGYSPPEKYSPAQGFGNTPEEEAEGETLEQRMAQEEPEPDPYADRRRGAGRIVDGDIDTARSATSARAGSSSPTRGARGHRAGCSARRRHRRRRR